jgi:hypothetical protein
MNLEGIIERKHPTPIHEDYLVTKEPKGLKVERLSDFSLITTFENENINRFDIKSEYLTIFYQQDFIHVFNLKFNKLVYSSKFFPLVFCIHEFMFCVVDKPDFIFFSAISGEHLRTARVDEKEKPYLCEHVAASRKGDILMEFRVNDLHHYAFSEFKKAEGRCSVM